MRPKALLVVTALLLAGATGLGTGTARAEGLRSDDAPPVDVIGSGVVSGPNVVGPTVPADVVEASSAPGGHWKPSPELFGVYQQADLPVRMDDGTILRADVYFPTGPDGSRAAGKFPVVMTQTPYGRRELAASQAVAGDQIGGANAFLVRRGYISVVVDVRGTGGSEGDLNNQNQREARDGATMVNWAAGLPGSNGKVGLYGASYLGINQLLTAAAVGKDSPLKAIFPIVASNNIYKDTITMGGIYDVEAIGLILTGLLGTLSTVGPPVNAVENPQHAASDLDPTGRHAANLATFHARFQAEMLSGGDIAYNDEYWHERNISALLSKIVDNGIPAYLVGGEYDLLQRAAPLNYVGLQNAFAGRPVNVPMSADEPTTGRYQLLNGPFGHLEASALDVRTLQLEWFDTFLKGQDTGMDKTPTPLHYYDLGERRYTEHARYPFVHAEPTRYYLGGHRGGSAPLSRNDGTLSTHRPDSGSDAIAWVPVGNPCSRAIDQWSAGIASSLTRRVTDSAPCIDNDVPGTLGPDRLTYSTEPLPEPKTIAGPIAMTVYASANTRQTEWVTQVDDVAPDGKSTYLSQGALLGSLRELDPDTTWRSGGDIIQAGHTYSRDSIEPVNPGQTTRYDIEVNPTYATIKAGHRIRVTISTSDAPHLVTSLPASAALSGGLYSVKHGAAGPSAIELSLVPAR